MRIGILTVSTSAAKGERATDVSGDTLVELVTAPPLSATVTQRAIVADKLIDICLKLTDWADKGRCDVILTTGGTGLAPTDVTPEATGAVLERAAPGIAEAMRAGTATATPLAWLSRGVAGTRGRTLIVNLPGSPKAVREYLAILLPLLPHAVDILTATVGQHNATSGGAAGE
jgi:molybdopterin adenylyltransferase